MKKFTLGLLTAVIFMPLVDMFMDLAAQWVQALKCRPMKIVREFNRSEETASTEEPEKKKFKWGFVQEDAPEEIEEESEESDEDFEEEEYDDE